MKDITYKNFEFFLLLKTLEHHAPLKKIVKANNVPYMTKTLQKAIMRRSALENKFYKNTTAENCKNYKKHKTYCSKLYKKEKYKIK